MRWFRALLADTWNGPRNIARAHATAGAGGASSASALLAARLLVLGLLYPIVGALLLHVIGFPTGMVFKWVVGILSIPWILGFLVLGPLASLLGVAFGILAALSHDPSAQPTSSGLVPSNGLLLFYGFLIIGAFALT
jgi:hypothetical protein